MTTILDKILVEKKKEVAELKKQTFSGIDRSTKSFKAMLKPTSMNIIAEIKRSSPSSGAIRMNVDPVNQAKTYEKLGATAISVLTDTPFFNGSIEDLRAVREAVSIPILCKDFIIDRIQIDRAKAAGANIILLIVAALDQPTLSDLYQYAKSLDLDVLCEVHQEDEMERALNLGADIIGINNRNLKTFQVDLHTTSRLAEMVDDPEIIIVSESGIRTRQDVEKAAHAGAKAILVGETLMRSTDLEATFKDLLIPLPAERVVRHDC